MPATQTELCDNFLQHQLQDANILVQLLSYLLTAANVCF